MISVSWGYGTQGSRTPNGGAIARAAQTNGLADNRRISLEGVRPEAIGEDNHAGGLGALILGPDEAPEHGMKTHHVEVRSTDHAGTNFARLAEADHREADRREVADRRHGLETGREILNLRDGEGGVLGAEAGRTLANVDQTILVAIHKRPQQHAANDAEDRGVGADAEGEREDDGERQPLRARQGAEGELQVGEEGHVR